MSVILLEAGDNCNDYRAEFQANRVLVLLAEQRGAGTVGINHVSAEGALALAPCPTCAEACYSATVSTVIAR